MPGGQPIVSAVVCHFYEGVLLGRPFLVQPAGPLRGFAYAWPVQPQRSCDPPRTSSRTLPRTSGKEPGKAMTGQFPEIIRRERRFRREPTWANGPQNADQRDDSDRQAQPF